MKHPAALAALGAASLLLAACGSADAEGPTAGAAATTGGGLEVAASFYPLEYVTARVAGDRATVTGLTPPGAEPHDLELAPRDVAALGEVDLVVHLEGLQPAVDDALGSADVASTYDAAQDADLDLVGGEDDHGHAEEEHAEGEHAEEEHAEEEHGHAEEGARDPHFWLDPTRLATVGDAIAERLAELDPDGAAQYQAGAADLRADLEALDAEYAEALAGCTVRQLVTSHEAFGYLAQRYDLEQVGISGLSPEDEPTAGRVAEVADLVRETGATTVYFETLASPALATTVAQEAGAATAVLDPLEGLTEESAGDDYLEVMRANLQVLRAGQSCP